MTQRLWTLALALAGMAGGLSAQRGGTMYGSDFQQAGTMATPGTGTIMVRASVITGKPFSATEERKTVQTLADGTLIENIDTDVYYRDSQGRTRTERTTAGKTSVHITDPVGGFSLVLDAAAKTATKAAMGGRGGAMFGGGGGRMPAVAPSAVGDKKATEIVAARGGGGRAMPAVQQPPRPTSEDLGVQTVNGVPAQGTRSTQIIPAGAIGNNREIHVVLERWFSSELGSVVKTVNTDPRFGVTTYQLTNISRAEPDAALFQIPADYTISEGRQ